MQGVTAKSWRLNGEDAEKLIAAWRTRKSRVVVDYEHQTLNAGQNGQPAPAAGWITDLAFEENRGLFASVQWTGRARAFIRAGEYRYISPVFRFDPRTGAITRLHSAALTNDPALDGMIPASARQDTDTEDCMKKETLAALVAFLSLKPDSGEDDVLAWLKEQKTPLAEALQARDAELAALKEKAPDPTKYAPVELLQAARAESAALAAKLAEIEKKSVDDALAAEIDAALKDGRLPKSCEAWARSTAQTQPDALREYLKTAVPVAALANMQTGGKAPKAPAAALTEEEKYVCRATGVAEKDFQARKAGGDA